eukprot:403352195
MSTPYPQMISAYNYVPYNPSSQIQDLEKQQTQIQNKPALKETTPVQSKVEQIKQIAENLDTPINSLPFLEKYHKSALKVEKLSQTVKSMSWGVGIIGVICFACAVLTFMSNLASQSTYAMNQQQSNSGKMKLQSGIFEEVASELASGKLIDEKTGEFDMKAASGTISMIVWGLIVAKAKAGQVAAVSKDHVVVKSQYKNAAILVAMVAIATFAQMKFESSFSSVQSKNETSKPAGRNLRAQMYESNQQDIEVVDHSSVLENAILSWRKEMALKSEKNVKKQLQSTTTKSQAPRVTQELLIDTAKEAFKWVSSIVFVALSGAYIYVFRQYHLAVEKHQQLTILFSNPNVRVATGDDAKQIMEHICNKPAQPPIITEEDKKQNIHKQLQAIMPQLYTQQQSATISAPTLANLPPTKRNNNNFDYSLCESIDYQRESLSTPLIESTSAIDKVRDILNQHQPIQPRKFQLKENLQFVPQDVRTQPVQSLNLNLEQVKTQFNPQTQSIISYLESIPGSKVITMSRNEFEQKYGASLPAQESTQICVEQQTVIENVATQSITQNNQLE